MNIENLGIALTKPYVPLRSLISGGILPEQCKAVLYGGFKSGKSTLLQYVGMCVAGGLPLFGSNHYNCTESKVLSIQLEIPHKGYIKRLQTSELSKIQKVQDNFWFCTEWWLKLDSKEGYARLEEAINNFRPQLLILDPLYKTVTGNENSSEDLGKVFDSLDILMERYNFALLFSAQGRKSVVVQKVGKIDMGDEELRGSTAIPAWVDSIIGIRPVRDTRRTISFNLRHGDKEAFIQDVEWNRQTGLYVLA